MTAPSVFLSYASEDREAARAIRDALPGYGVEVWYDESELGGGDSWDQKIRRQIRECDYFMPLVSAHTEARLEGYFRREWRLAVERTLDMADDHAFLLPLVVDDTDQGRARVPEKFLMVQWLRVPGGRPTPALEALCRRIVSGEAKAAPSRKADRPAGMASARATAASPEFPREEPGQRLRFWFHVVGWAVRSVWIRFQQLPRWIRITAWIWLIVILFDRGCSGTSTHGHRADISPAQTEKLKEISEGYQGRSKPADVAKLGAQIAREFTDDSADDEDASALLAIPFTVPAGDTDAAKMADSTFALVYGKIAVSQQGHVSLNKDPLASPDLAAAVRRGRARHATYVLYGGMDSQGSIPMLNVGIAVVADGSLLWSKSYPRADADPARIAAEVNAKIPSLGGG